MNRGTLFDVRYAPDSRLKADIPGFPRRATFGLMRRSKELVRFVPFVKTGCYDTECHRHPANPQGGEYEESPVAATRGMGM